MAATEEKKRRPRGSNDCVRVAVRCRPFKDYEIQGKAKLVVGMDPYNDTDTSFNSYLETPTGQKKWGFDFSFWSHDDLKGPIITQDKLYNIIGVELLDDFMDDFNVCLFAYGQSGSGKTYSMVGVPKVRTEWGIVPRIGEDICKAMKANNSNPNRTTTWKLSVTMVEIYREVVRDLLIDNSPEIKVTRGPDPAQKGKEKTIMVGVNPSPVKDWDELFALICSSQERKSVAATGLNDKSSRAHTIFEIILTKTTYPVPTDAKQNHSVVNSIRLVDLAGSERLNKSSANAAFNEQTRLEGIAINQSLTNLGAIIKQVGKTSSITNEKERQTKLNALSWRNSQLTMLLRDALAGNCRTVMIAAVSPADLNWEESKGTLDWAAACKEVKLKSTKILAQLTPLEKTQAELTKVKAELEELKKKAAAGGAVGADPEATKKIAALQAELAEQAAANAENDRLLAEVKRQREAAEAKQKMRLTVPHFALLAQDPGLSRMKEYFTAAGVTKVGVLAGDGGITLTGVKAIDNHATINNTGGNVTVTPFEHAFTLINGRVKTTATTLAHNDRVVFGHSNFFVFQDPRIMATQSDEVKRRDAEKFDYNYCLNESHEETVGKVIREAKERQEAEEKERERERQHRYELELVEQKKRDAELAAEKAELKRNADESQKEIAKLLAAQAEEKKKLESARAADAAQQEALRKQLAELKARQDEAKAQAAEMERKYKAQQQELRDREAEEARRKSAAIKREEARELNRKRDHQRWEARLRELMPLVNNCNEMCSEMNIDQSFAIVPISEEDDVGAPNTNVFVSVQRGGVQGQSLWDDDVFIDKCSEMKSIWGKWKKTNRIELPESDRLNPFFDSASDVQPLGRGGLVCEYLYERMPFEDHLSIIDHQGRMNGRLEVKAEVFVDPAVERALGLKEDEDGPPALRLLKGKQIDIGMKIISAGGLPTAYQQNVYVSYRWPRFITLEPIAEPLKPKVAAVVDENIDGDNDVHTQMTQVQNKAQPFTASPVFNYNKYFRVLVTDELLDWLKEGQLQLEVHGVHNTSAYREEFLRKIASMNKAAAETKTQGAITPRPAAADGKAEEKKTNLSDEMKRAEHLNKTKLAVVRGVLLESKMKLKEKRESTGRVGGQFDRQSSTITINAGASMAAAAAAEEQARLKRQLEAAEKKAADSQTALDAERKAHDDDHKAEEKKLSDTEKLLKQREAEVVAARKEAEDAKTKLAQLELANQQKSKSCVIL